MQAYVDRVDDLELIERLGVIRSLTRKVRVKFEDADNIPQDFSVLTSALSVCPPERSSLQAVDDPVYGAVKYKPYNTLFLVERNPKLIEGDVSWVDVILKYEHVLDGANQALLVAPQRNQAFVFGKRRTSIVDKTTNFYQRNGDPNQPRTLIQVAHTFPTWDNRASAIFTDPNLPKTVTQAGEISIPFPNDTYHLEGFVTTENPDSIHSTFIRAINDDVWLGKPALTWMCSSVESELLDKDKNLYKFTFEFQFNFDTWNPTVAFHDQATGRPPADLSGPDNTLAVANPASTDPVTESWRSNIYTAPNLQPLGYWQVPALKPVNFPGLFQTINFG